MQLVWLKGCVHKRPNLGMVRQPCFQRGVQPLKMFGGLLISIPNAMLHLGSCPKPTMLVYTEVEKETRLLFSLFLPSTLPKITTSKQDQTTHEKLFS